MTDKIEAIRRIVAEDAATVEILLQEFPEKNWTPLQRRQVYCATLLAALDAANKRADWRKGAHMEGVADENTAVHAAMKQCQQDNGALRKERDELRQALADAPEPWSKLGPMPFKELWSYEEWHDRTRKLIGG